MLVRLRSCEEAKDSPEYSTLFSTMTQWISTEVFIMIIPQQWQCRNPLGSLLSFLLTKGDRDSTINVPCMGILEYREGAKFQLSIIV